MRNGAPEPTSLRTSFIGPSGRSHSRRSIQLESRRECASAMCSRTRATARAPSLETVFQSGSSHFGPSASSSNQRPLLDRRASSSILHDRTRAEANARRAQQRTISAEKRIAALGPHAFRKVTWRRGTEGTSARRIRRDSCARGRRSSRQRRRALAGRRSLAHRREANRRDPLLPEQSRSLHVAESSRRERQSTLVLRTSTPATKRRTRPGSLREAAPGTVCTITPCSRWWPSPFSNI